MYSTVTVSVNWNPRSAKPPLYIYRSTTLHTYIHTLLVRPVPEFRVLLLQPGCPECRHDQAVSSARISRSRGRSRAASLILSHRAITVRSHTSRLSSSPSLAKSSPHYVKMPKKGRILFLLPLYRFDCEQWRVGRNLLAWTSDSDMLDDEINTASAETKKAVQ